MGTTTTIQKRNVEWFNEECREKIAKNNEARRRMLQKETRGSYEKYKKLQKEVKKVCKQKKKEHLQKQLEEIEQLDRQDERRNFYKAMDKIVYVVVKLIWLYSYCSLLYCPSFRQ